MAKQYQISRQEQDELAAESQRRTKISMERGYFDKEILPIPVTVKGETVFVSKDETPRPDTTVQSLNKLEPIFAEVIYSFFKIYTFINFCTNRIKLIY